MWPRRGGRRLRLKARRGVLGLYLDGWPAVQVIAGTPAADAGLRTGDALLQIAGRSVAQTGTANDVMKLLAGPPGASIQLTMGRTGQQFTVQVKRVSLAAMRVKGDLVAPGVVSITIPPFEGSGIADRVKRIIQDRVVGGQARAVILDVRGNPGGRPEEANAVADISLDNKCLVIMRFRNGQRVAFRSHPGSLNVQVIVLTDGNTGSGAEMLAMALRDNGRAVIVGQTTAGALFGKDGEDVGDNQVILFRSEPTVLSPTGKDYSIAGIPPDVPVAGPKEQGKDEVLRLAVELAGRGINAMAPSGQ